jgi:hypothetical protein
VLAVLRDDALKAELQACSKMAAPSPAMFSLILTPTPVASAKSFSSLAQFRISVPIK